MLIELATVLTLFCGIDYAGDNEKACIKQTKKCIEQKVAKIGKMDKTKQTILQEDIVFQCFKAGTVSKK